MKHYGSFRAGTSPAIVLFDLDEKRLLCPHFADEEKEVERGKDRNLFALMANQTLFAIGFLFTHRGSDDMPPPP